MTHNLLFLTLFALLCLGGSPQATPAAAMNDDTVTVDQPAPAFEATDENDDTHTLATLHDEQYLVLSFSRAHW